MSKTPCLSGFKPELVFDKILKAIEQGATVDQIRDNPVKYLVSGQTKEIVYNSGGEGLKVSHELITEMARRGDKLAQFYLDQDKFQTISTGWNKSEDPNASANAKRWVYLELSHCKYDRENATLIEILKEDKIHNIGGWGLRIATVHVEPNTYKVCKSDDHWGSEYVKGRVNKSGQVCSSFNPDYDSDSD